jgi:DNA-binding PadR family transcriptional regulator
LKAGCRRGFNRRCCCEAFGGAIGLGLGMGFGVRRGDFRYRVLLALSEKPMHGYALIQEIGKTSQRPISAGLIYPTLQELEDMGYVSSDELEGKKTYSLTLEGRKCLEENHEIVERLKAGKAYAEGIGRFSFMKDLQDIQSLVLMNEGDIDEGKISRIHEVVTDSKKRVAAIVFE